SKLDACGRAEVLGCGVLSDLQRTLGTAESALAVGHDREEAVTTAHTAGGPEVGEGLLPLADGVGGHTRGLTHTRDPGGLTAREERVLVGALGILLEQETCGDHMLADEFGEGLGQ